MKSFIIIYLFSLLNSYPTLFLKESDFFRTYVYYDVKFQLPLRIISIENSLSNSTLESYQSMTKLDKEVVVRRLGFRNNGCTCQEFTCGCCIGFNFQQFNFNREGCLNLTYEPFAFAIHMNMLMDGNSIFTNTISAKNPPPVCIPVPIPYLPAVDFCVKLFDIHTSGQNLFVCLDFETRIERATVLILHFNCMRMGTAGVALTKPGENSLEEFGTTDGQVNADVYDEVTEVKYKNSSKLHV